MESKKIITGDYQDTTTGIRFLQDTEGRIHCMSCMANPNSGGVTNNYNTTNNNYYQQSDEFSGVAPTMVQTAVMDVVWPSTTDFYRVNNTYSGGYLGYTTPINKEFHITNLLASQGSANLSLLGLYRGGNLLMSIPLMQDINLTFFRPITIPPATYVEIKFRPGAKKLSLAVCLIGYLI